MPRRALPALVGALLVAAAAVRAGEAVPQSIEIDGVRVEYTLKGLEPGDLHRAEPDEPEDAARRSAIGTGRSLHRVLAAGRIEDAALLSNSPRRRHEVLTDYRDAVGDEAFRRVFSEYFDGRNALIAEIAFGERRLLLWRLGDAPQAIAGEIYVEVEGRYYLDDVPSAARTQLRQVLEAYRSGARRIRSIPAGAAEPAAETDVRGRP